MKYLTVTISNAITEEEAENALQKLGLEPLFSSSDEECNGETQIACKWKKGWEKYQTLLPWITKIEEEHYDGVDWSLQWEIHGPPTEEGLYSVEIEKYGLKGRNITLSAGPGFGDLSHSTTQQMLQLMAPHTKRALFVDIGCGSGILSLAALAAGAERAIAIDIEESALQHTLHNSLLNDMGENIECYTPQACPPIHETNTLLAMNMIQSEQRVAWDSLKKKFVARPTRMIASGILKEGKIEYLEETKNWGWQLLQEREKEGWCAFLFQV